MEIQEKYLLIFCLYRSTIIWLSAIKETHIPYTWKGTANIMLRQKTKHVNDFGKDSVPSLVLRVSIPFMFAQFVNVLYSIVDRIYVGNIPEIGAISLAGAGVCAPIITLLSSFATLVGIGGSILFSMRLGQGDKKEAERILGNCFSLLLILSAVLTVLFLLTKDLLLRWFGASDASFPYADTYLTIYTCGTFFALLSMGMNYFITAQGHPMLGMVTTLIGAIVNIILDPVFIFLFHMNIAGAAVATVLAQLSSCIFVLCVLRSGKMSIPLHLKKPERQLAGRIFALGFSPFLILATDSVIIIAMNAVLQYHGGPGYGDTLITCATIVQSYMLLITSPMLGITGGSQPLISYNYGAGNQARIRRIVLCVLLLCIGFTTVMFLISRFLPSVFAGIFTDNPEYIELSVWGIRAFTLMIIPFSFQYTFVDSLTALGLTRLSLSLSRGFPDRPGTDQAFPFPVSLPEMPLFFRHLPAALRLRRSQRLLCGARGGRHQLPDIHRFLAGCISALPEKTGRSFQNRPGKEGIGGGLIPAFPKRHEPRVRAVFRSCRLLFSDKFTPHPTASGYALSPQRRFPARYFPELHGCRAYRTS